MSEFAPQPDPNEALRIHDKELGHLGALVTEAAFRSDLDTVAADGWVTADKVQGVYAQDIDGQVKNIIAPEK